MKTKLTLLLMNLLILSFLNAQDVIEIRPKRQHSKYISVKITGLNTHFASGTGTSVVFKQGSTTIIQGSVIANNNNKIDFTSNLPNYPVVGFYDMHIQNATDGNHIIPNAIFVCSNKNANLEQPYPLTSGSSTNLNVTVSGTNTHFASGTGTTAYFVQGTNTIAFNSTSNVQNLNFLGNVSIPYNSHGFYDMMTYNSVDGFQYFDYAINVINATKPHITSVSPDTLTNAVLGVNEIHISAINTHFLSSPNYVYSNNFLVPIDSFKVISNTEIIAYTNIQVVAKSSLKPNMILSIANQIDGLIQVHYKFDIIGGNRGEDQLFSTIRIRPNPFENSFYIENEDIDFQYDKMEVFNNLGIKICEFNKSNILTNKIDLDGYNSGIYYLIISKNDKRITYKLVKK